MLKHVTILGSVAMSLAVSTGALAQDVTAETVVATVGETEITLGELIIARGQLPQQFSQLPDEMLFPGLVDQLIQQQLLADVVETVPLRVEQSLINERRSMLAAETATVIADAAVTEDAIQAAYDARYSEVEQMTEYNASHLLVETEEEAIAAKARIDDGTAFGDVARDVSTGPTGPNGGNLGWFGAGAMVAEFETTIAALEVGEVSDPFETQFGWHVATLNDIRDQAAPPLEQVRNQLVAELQEAAVSARLEELAAAETIVRPQEGQFDPSLISNFDLLD